MSSFPFVYFNPEDKVDYSDKFHRDIFDAGVTLYLGVYVNYSYQEIDRKAR